jgi:FkbM family methyltransferase
MLQRRIATALSVLQHEGFREVARVSLEKAAMWWRQGDAFELLKLVGRSTPVARLDGCRFTLDAAEVSESLKYLLLSGKHEAPERALVRQFVNPALPLVELGGALGVVSCIANRLLTDPDRHVVVEANPSLIPVLAANRDLNGSRFTVLNRVVGYDQPFASFPIARNVLASSLRVETGHRVTVPTTSLAGILDEFGFDRSTVICDIEGAEAELIRRESATLASRVDTIIIEVHDQLLGVEQTRALWNTLRDAGFEVMAAAWDTVALRRT